MPEHKPNARDEARELKVKIPVQVHVQLHSVKILTGRRISDVVTEALAAYFEAHPQADAEFARPPGLARQDARDAWTASLAARGEK